jgi:ATP phosphoribosyltransferase
LLIVGSNTVSIQALQKDAEVSSQRDLDKGECQPLTVAAISDGDWRVISDFNAEVWNFRLSGGRLV